MKDSVNLLAAALAKHRQGNIAVVTGAGISLASGIPTFRGTDPDAVWKRDVTELGTHQFFQQDPVTSWRWSTSRFDMVLDKQPNPAHYALVHLEQWVGGEGGTLTVVTQNVDTLHESAGTEALIKVHGSVDKARCSSVRGCEYGAPAGFIPRADVDMTPFFADPSTETLPRCPGCGSVLRQHVLWFDEFYDGHQDYQWPRVCTLAGAMDTVLFVGTSFAVGVTELFLQGALQKRIPAIAVDPGARNAPYDGVSLLREKSEELLPAVCEVLSAGG